MFFKKGHPNNIEYPVRNLKDLKTMGQSFLVSARKGKKQGFNNPYTDTNIHEYLDEVLAVREDVKAGKYPHQFMKDHYPWDWREYPEHMPQPLYSKGLRYDSPKNCANIVHMDNPMDLAIAIQSWLITDGVKVRKWRTRFLPVVFKEFLKTVPGANRYIARKQDMALTKAFKLKYYYGVIRPEELYSGSENITAYREGCPCHPSFCAGHGAAAGAVARAIYDYYDLSDEQIVVVRNCAYLWSMWRTLAGVHYAPDNIAGLEIGGLLKKGYTNKRYAI